MRMYVTITTGALLLRPLYSMGGWIKTELISLSGLPSEDGD